jgi:hypothetical protein
VFTIKETGLEVYLKDYEGVFTRFYHFDDFSRRANRTFTETKPKFLRIGIAMLVAAPFIIKTFLYRFQRKKNRTNQQNEMA